LLGLKEPIKDYKKRKTERPNLKKEANVESYNLYPKKEKKMSFIFNRNALDIRKY